MTTKTEEIAVSKTLIRPHAEWPIPEFYRLEHLAGKARELHSAAETARQTAVQLRSLWAKEQEAHRRAGTLEVARPNAEVLKRSGGGPVLYRREITDDEITEAERNIGKTLKAWKAAESKAAKVTERHDPRQTALDAGTRFYANKTSGPLTLGATDYWRGAPVPVEALKDLPEGRLDALLRSRMLLEVVI